MKYAIASTIAILTYATGRWMNIEAMIVIGFIAVVILAWVGVINYVFEPEKIWKDEGF